MSKNRIMKLIYTFFIAIFILSCTSASFANNEIAIESTDISDTAFSRTTLELVDDTVCTINLSDIGRFEKKITQFDAKNKSATLTLTLTNLKQVEESQLPVEIFLVIDNSSSMEQNKVDEQTRKEVVINSANNLVDKLFATNANAKVGVVSFSSLDSVKGEIEGTINDANLILGLNSSKSEVKDAIAQVSSSETGPRTNIEAGLTIASENYSSDANTKRYIVLLTDGVPNNALDGSFGTYIGTVATRTKAKLQEIEASGIGIIGAMIGLEGDTVEYQSQKTYKALSEEVFGTVENPTITEYYYIPDNINQIETTIVENIFEDIVSIKDNTLRNIVIKDYFPQEIIDNFNFEYVASPNIGNVSTAIDTTDNSITWNIETLAEGEVATLSYKLTLKDDYNKEIVDKILPTNEKVDITAENAGDKIEETSDDSPTVRVRYTEPEPEPPQNEVIIPDNTVSPKPIPQTGITDTTAGFIIIVSLIAIIAGVRFYLLKRETNK